MKAVIGTSRGSLSPRLRALGGSSATYLTPPGAASMKKTCEFLGRAHDLPLGVQPLYDAEGFRCRGLFEREHRSLPVAGSLGEEC